MNWRTVADITVHLQSASGRVQTITGRVGRSLMHAAVGANADGIAADCGGLLSCATCHVMVDGEWAMRLPPPGADEESMLEMTAAPREAGSRLSCQIELTPELAGLLIRLPATQY